MSLEQLLTWIPAGHPDEALARRVHFDRLPAHIAIIMDGNGRWAAQRHLPRVEGHRAGIDAVRDTVETSARSGRVARSLSLARVVVLHLHQEEAPGGGGPAGL